MKSVFLKAQLGGNFGIVFLIRFVAGIPELAWRLRINMLASALIPGGGRHPVAVVIHLAVFLTLQEVQGGDWRK